MMTDVGIDDKFINRVGEQVTPGTSPLFVLTSDAVIDKVEEAFAGQKPELISTNLSNEEEEMLRSVFLEAWNLVSAPRTGSVVAPCPRLDSLYEAR